MSLQTRITALVQAIGADIKALYSGKVGTSDARLTDAREWTASTVTQAEAEAGTATTRRAWTAQRVFQAIAAWWAASAMKTKLDGIAAGATANATDAQLRDRSTHTGTQAISTVTGLQTALDGKLATSARGVANGVASLDANGLIPPMQLPSYVDDVLEYAATSNFPATGETGKIYIAVNGATPENPTKQYRWTGTAYSEITSSPGSTDAVPEGSGNLYFTAARVRSTVLTGLSLASSAAVAATDNVLTAFGKIQARLNLLGTAAYANLSALPGRVTITGTDAVPLKLERTTSTNVSLWLQHSGASRYLGINSAGNYAVADSADITNNGNELWHSGNFDPATKQDKSSIVSTATTRTLALTDAWNYVRPGTTSAITLTVPTNASVAFDIRTEITVRASGNITLAAASGVTLNAPSGGTLNMTARMTVTLKKVATNEWDVIGQTVAA